MDIYNEAQVALVKLLKINTVQAAEQENMPFGKGNADALSAFLAMLADMGMQTKNLDNYIGFGDIGEGELFGILGHLDVVPVGEGWTQPPFGAHIEGGEIFARGALDNKGPMVAAAFALKKLLQEGKKPQKTIRIIAGCNEESGWKCIEHYLKNTEMPESGFSPDADFPVINCEKGIVNLTISCKNPTKTIKIEGGTRANVVPDSCTVQQNGKKTHFFGKSAHAAHPDMGENAITKALSFLKKRHPAFAELHEAFGQTDGSGAGLDLPYFEDDKLTLNLGTIQTTAEKLTCVVDIRYPINYNKDQIAALVAEKLPRFEVKIGHHHPPLFVPKDDKLVVELLSAYKNVTGREGAPITIGGGTYARAMKHGVAFGPIHPDQISTIHQKDERISIADFNLLIDIYADALDRLCF